MNAHDVELRTLRPGPDGWEAGTMTLTEVRRMAACAAPPAEPATTAQLAVDGRPVGATSDVLRVAALVCCRVKRDVLGVVLHLDRSARGFGPLWLAELTQRDGGCDPFRELSAESMAGRTSDGTRLDRLAAVPIPGPPRATLRRTLVSCLNYECADGHLVTVAELIDAGRRGMECRGSGDTPRYRLRVPVVQR